MVFFAWINNKILNDEIANFLKNICSEIGERYSFEFDAIGCDGDHVYIFVGVEQGKFSKNTLRLENRNEEEKQIYKQMNIIDFK